MSKSTSLNGEFVVNFSKHYFFYSIKKGNWKFVLSLVIVSVILWFYSLTTTSLSNITDFGLVTALPLTYFISLSILSISFVISLFSFANKKLLFLQIILLIMFLFLTPVLIEGARQRFAYNSYAVSDYIIRTGFADPAQVAYSNWPSFQIFTAIFVMITGVNASSLIPFCSPFLMELAMLLPLYFFFKTVSNNNLKIWLSLWVFYFANWGSRDYLSSQTFSFILFILIFTLLTFIANRNLRDNSVKDSDRAILIAAIILFISVVAGHQLSAIIPLGILFVLYITKYFKSKYVLLNFVVIVVGWTVYAANVYVIGNFRRLSSEITDVLSNVFMNFNKTGANQVWGRVLTNEVKMIYAIIFLVFAFINLVIAYKKKTLNRTDKLMLFSIIGIWILFLLPYGGEVFTRLWLFSLPLIVFFVVKTVDHRKIFAIFAIFIILFSPTMFVWARYGEETYDYITPSELSGSKFLRSSTVPSCLLIGNGDHWASTQEGFGVYRVHYLDFIINKDNITLALEYTMFGLRSQGVTDPLYLIFSHGNSERYRRLYSEPELFDDFAVQLSNSTIFNKIYSNPNFEMYEASK
ncbi:MAG: hypothetical protein FWB84_01430 [Candidatus Bathyarchaeota archaeon]|uniref:hypothetical protein n=1 Tax=Candidatus Bathycorpusculum sp. TaxID=2994959 RepID=UPI002839A1D1|nr:hypothetical protein [Candidatus Termiticorpusculum sp.]MCL2256911.1 hypothetical protein [Candidatus Termiticorpusculum sp.]MCL2292965.1 hypothetical protein [Candidatus Termiticorpusculum sp.]